ncbi:MAG: Gfo/Idh/MocA family oxidoreductase [Armatimonadetes bacterium]|nr:Gfo/Idh/MocA family oxidoreductase [Armatimonadota bacterium]
MAGLKVGLIGLGGVARWTHLPALAKIDPEIATLHAVCDRNAELAAKTAAEAGGTAYTEPERLLDEAGCDCLIIGIPPHLHGDLEHRCIAARLPFLMEKPAHRHIEQAIEIADAVDAAGLVAGVGYLDRYQRSNDAVREFLASSPAGAFTGYWIGGIYNVPWWIKRDQGGGQHFEQTTHIYDLSRYFFGEVVEVFARGVTGLNNDIDGYDIEDASAATLVFESGLVGVVWSGCFVRQAPGRNGMDIFTRSGRVEYHNRSHVVIHTKGGQERTERETDQGLAEDLAFFENLVPAGDKLEIHRFKVERDALPGEYRYRLLLLQGGRRERPFQGSLQLLVSVQEGGRDAMITLPAAGDSPGIAYRLSFKHFFRVEGNFRVPAAAKVRSVQARVLESGSNQARATQQVDLS